MIFYQHSCFSTGPVRTEGPVRTASPVKPHLDMSAIAAAMNCNYSIEQIREAVLRFFMLTRESCNADRLNYKWLLCVKQATKRSSFHDIAL